MTLTKTHLSSYCCTIIAGVIMSISLRFDRWIRLESYYLGIREVQYKDLEYSQYKDLENSYSNSRQAGKF